MQPKWSPLVQLGAYCMLICNKYLTTDTTYPSQQIYLPHIPMERIHNYGPWIINSGTKEGESVSTIKFCHLNHVVASISPVHFFSHPVNSKAIRSVNIRDNLITVSCNQIMQQIK